MLLAAASVIGYGREQDLPNFRATDAAFGEIPAAFNDSFLPLNELGAAQRISHRKIPPLPRLHLWICGGPRHDVLESGAD